MPVIEAKLQTQTQTTHATTIAASLMVSISAAAMLFSWGMMAVVAGNQMMQRARHQTLKIAAAVQEPY